MNKQAVGLSRKKQYFTQSQTILPSMHPQQQFLSLISIKKQFQSLIKKQLDVLQQFENEETREVAGMNKEMQKKEINIMSFQSHYTKQIQREEKSEKQFIECYNVLKRIKTEKLFKQLMNYLKIRQERNTKSRASKFYHSNNIEAKYFKIWKESVNPSIIQQQFKNQQLNQFLFNNYKARLFINLNVLLKISKLRQLKSILSKKSFKNKLAEQIQAKKIQMQFLAKKEQVKKRIKNGHLTYMFIKHKRNEQIYNKIKLLININCHRKINLFFKRCKENIFNQQKEAIINNICSRINIMEILNQEQEYQESQQKPDLAPHNQQRNNHLATSFIENKVSEESDIYEQLWNSKQATEYKNYTQIHLNLINKPKHSLNIKLLNLILQNCIQEYAFQYELNLDDSIYMNLLHDLKTKCLIKLNKQRQKKQFYISLQYKLKQKSIINLLSINRKRSFIIQLARQSQNANQQLMLQQYKMREHVISFYSILQNKKIMKKKTDKLLKRKNIPRCIIRNAFICIRAYMRQNLWLKFNVLISSQFRKTKLLRQSLVGWKSFKQTDYSSKEQQQNKIHQHILESPKSKRRTPKIKQIYSERLNRRIQQQDNNEKYQNNQRVIKTKMQLSKIVNEINKNNKQMSRKKMTLDIQEGRQPVYQHVKIPQEDALAKQFIQEEQHNSNANKQVEEPFATIEQYDRFQQQIKRSGNESQQQDLFQRINKLNKITLFNSKVFMLKRLRMNHRYMKSKVQLQSTLVKHNKESFILNLIGVKESSQKINLLSEHLHNKAKKIFIPKLKQYKKLLNKQAQLNKNIQDSRIHAFISKLQYNFDYKINNEWIKDVIRYKKAQFVQLLKKATDVSRKSRQLRQVRKEKKQSQIMIQLGHSMINKDLNSKLRRCLQHKDFNSKRYFLTQLKRLARSNQLVEIERPYSLQQQISEQSILNQSQNSQLILQKYLQNKQNQSKLIFHSNYAPKQEKQPSQDDIGQQQQEDNEYKQTSNEKNIINREDENGQCNMSSHRSNFISHQLQDLLDHNDSDMQTPLQQDQQNEQQDVLQSDVISQQNDQIRQLERVVQSNLQQQIKLSIIKQYFKQFSFVLSLKIKRKRLQQLRLLTLQKEMMNEMKKRFDIKTKLRELKRCIFNGFIQKLSQFQNQRRRKEQAIGIVNYCRNKHDKLLKKKAFESMLDLIENKHDLSLKIKCFKGLQIYSRQKKMLKQYLQMQQISYNEQVQYYPTTQQIHQKYKHFKESYL